MKRIETISVIIIVFSTILHLTGLFIKNDTLLNFSFSCLIINLAYYNYVYENMTARRDRRKKQVSVLREINRELELGARK